MSGERVADGEHVAVEVHGRLRSPGGAGGEGEHRDVVARGEDVVERRGLGGHPLGPGVVAERERRHAERLDGFEEPVVDQRGVEVGDLVDGLELTGAQQRHGGDEDGTGLEHAEPGRGEPLVVGPAEQDAVARDDPEVLDEDVRDPVRGGQQLVVRPGREARLVQARPVAAVPLDHVVEQGGRGVETVGVVELGQREDQLGPLVVGREVVATERVDVGRGQQLHGRQGMPVRDDGQECAIGRSELSRSERLVPHRDRRTLRRSRERGTLVWFYVAGAHRGRGVRLVAHPHQRASGNRNGAPRRVRPAGRRRRVQRRPTVRRRDLTTPLVRRRSRRSPSSARRWRPTRTTRSRAGVRRGPSRRRGRGRRPPR